MLSTERTSTNNVKDVVEATHQPFAVGTFVHEFEDLLKVSNHTFIELTLLTFIHNPN